MSTNMLCIAPKLSLALLRSRCGTKKGFEDQTTSGLLGFSLIAAHLEAASRDVPSKGAVLAEVGKGYVALGSAKLGVLVSFCAWRWNASRGMPDAWTSQDCEGNTCADDGNENVLSTCGGEDETCLELSTCHELLACHVLLTCEVRADSTDNRGKQMICAVHKRMSCAWDVLTGGGLP